MLTLLQARPALIEKGRGKLDFKELTTKTFLSDER